MWQRCGKDTIASRYSRRKTRLKSHDIAASHLFSYVRAFDNEHTVCALARLARPLSRAVKADREHTGGNAPRAVCSDTACYGVCLPSISSVTSSRPTARARSSLSALLEGGTMGKREGSSVVVCVAVVPQRTIQGSCILVSLRSDLRKMTYIAGASDATASDRSARPPSLGRAACSTTSKRPVYPLFLLVCACRTCRGSGRWIVRH